MKRPIWTALMAMTLLSACTATPPIRTVDYVDLDRFMGDWYVIANIPTFVEEGAHNAVESYALNEDGTIDTTFTFNDGAFDGEQKRYNPTGYVRDEKSNAVWGMQFIWPFKAEYLVVYLNDDYTQTIIGRSKRDYVWIMAREPEVPEEDYQRMLALLRDEGYDISRIEKVPQSW